MALTSFVLLAIVAGAFAGPINLYDEGTTKCALSCPTTSKFSYTPGQTYDFSYTADITTHIPGVTQDRSSLHLTAVAQVEVLSQCELALKLSEVSLKDSNPTGTQDNVENAWNFKRALQERPLRFGFVDGRIESLCPEEAEETWVLNIKRGVLSTFQNTMDSFERSKNTKEADVSGNCDVRYEVGTGSWGHFNIRKTKNLLSCEGHQKINSVFQGVPYKAQSRIQSLPLLKSTHECQQQIKTDGILAKSECEETHIFRPFSNGGSGASTHVKASLIFQRQNAGVSTSEASITRRSTIQFEHLPNTEALVENRREAMETLRTICEETPEDVRPETPAMFSALVKDLRKLDIDNLIAIEAALGRLCPKAKSYFRDAVPALGTTASLSLMRDLITRGEISESEADMWLASMAFIPNPTKGMLAEVKPLLDSVNRKTALSVSALVSSYCKHNPECGEELEVKQIVNIFKQNLGRNCRASNDEEHEKILMSLKAIGNTGHAENVVPVLNRCILEESNPMEIRVAATNAFRNMACTADHTELMNVFTNAEIDSELRINAYLAMMQCPTTRIFERVRYTLEKEEVNQVGSFVWSHLTNLAETSSPFKQDIRYIVENEKLQKEFNMDTRKFSRNIEWSAFYETLNTGAVVDSNLIWSPKSYIPRSAMVNLTVDIFGQSVNLMEMGGRVEGLEGLLEKYLGPNDKDIKNKRSSNNDINTIDEQYGAEQDTPKGSYYLRVFGNEIRYDDFHGFDMSTVKDKLNYLQWLIDLAKEHSFDFSKSVMFLDADTSVPTIVGMPLRLSVDGSAVMDLKIKGKMDLRNIAVAPRSIDIDGSVKPSAAIEVNCEMGVDAYVARTGLKMSNTFHTSTLADGKIQLKDGKIFNLDINTPNDKMEVFSAQSKFFIKYRNQDREQRMLTDGRTEISRCFGGSMVKVLGLELCGEMSVPTLYQKDAAYYPLTGPSSINVVLHKRDTFTGYHFDTKFIQKKQNQGGDLEAQISFNTPGSKIDREMTIILNYQPSDKAVNFDLRTPWKKFGVTGSLVDQEDMKRAVLRALLDESVEYSIISEIKVEKNRYNTKFTPDITITIPHRPAIHISGNMLYRPNKKIDIEARMDGVFEDAIIINGDINKKKTGYLADLALKSSSLESKVKGFVERTIARTAGSSSGRLDIEYEFKGAQKEKIVYFYSGEFANNANKKNLKLESNFKTTMWREYNSDFTLEINKQGQKIVSSFDGGLTSVKRKRLSISQTGTFDLTSPNKKFDLYVTVKLPVKRIDYELNINHAHNRESLEHTTTLKNGREETRAAISAKRESTEPLKMSLDASLSYPGRHMSYIHTLEEKTPKEYTHDFKIELDKADAITLHSVHKFSPRHELTAELNIPGMEPMRFTGHLNPHLKNFQMHADLDAMAKKFITNAEWRFRGNSKQYTSNGALEVNLPDYDLNPKMTVESNFQDRTFSSSLTGQLDSSRTFSTNVEVIASDAIPSFKVKSQWWPNRYIELSGDLKHDKQGWWSRTRDLEGSLTFMSSFENFESMKAAFKHERTPQNVLTHGEVTWGKNRKIDGDIILKKLSGWSNVEMQILFTTPFSELRSGKYDLTYNLESNSLTSNQVLHWNNKQMALEFSGLLNLRQEKAQFDTKFTSPFQYYEEITAFGKFNNNNGNIKTILKTSWAPNKQIVLTMNMQHQRNGYYINNNGELLITTPFNYYESNKLSWSHNNDDSVIRCHAEMEVRNTKSVYDLVASNKISGRRRVVTASAMIDSPYLTNMNLNFNHENDMHTYRNFKTSSKMQVGGYNGELEHSMNIGPDMINIDTTFVLPGMEPVTISLNNKWSRNIINIKNELKWSNNKKTSLDGILKYNGPTFEGNLRFDMPDSPAYIIAVSNKNENNIWVTDSSFQYAPGRKVETQTKLGWTGLKKMSFEIKSLCPYLRSMAFDIEHAGHLRNFNTKAQLDYHMLGGLIVADVKMDTANLDNINGQVDIKTPFNRMESIRMTVGHQKNGQTYKTEASYEMPRYKYSAAHEMTLNDWIDFSTTTTVASGRKSIEVSTKLQPDPLTGMVGFKSPITGLEEITINFNHRGNLRSFETIAELITSAHGKMTGTVEFQNRKTIKGVAKFTSPFEGHEEYEIQVTHRGDLRSFTTDAAIQMGRKKMTGRSTFSLDGTTLRASTSVKTPFRGFRGFNFNFLHQGELTNFNQEATLDYSREKITWVSQFSMQQKITGKVELTTPFDAVKNFNFNFAHEGGLRNFRNSATVVLNSETHTANSDFRLSGNTMDANLDINTPLGLNLKVTIKHNGQLSDFTNSFDAEVNGDKFIARSELHTASGIEGKVVVDTPGVRINGVIKHEGNLYKFKNSASLDFNGERVSGSSDFILRRAGLTGSANLNTPGIDVQVEIEHRGPPTNFQNSASVTYNRMKYMATSEFNLENTAVRGKAEVTIPRKNPIKLSFEHAGDYSNFENSAVLELMGSSYSANSNFNLENLKGKAVLRVPEEYSMELFHEGSAHNFKYQVIVKYPGETMTATTTYKYDGNNMEADFLLVTPFSVLRTFGMGTTFSGKWNNFQHTAYVRYQEKEITANTNFKYNRAGLDTRFQLKTPYDEVQNFIVDYNHKGVLTDFECKGFIQLNNYKIEGDNEFKLEGNTLHLKTGVKIPEEYCITIDHQGDLYDFSNTLSVEFNRQVVSGTSAFKFNGNNVEGSVIITTPFRGYESHALRFNHQGDWTNFNNEASFECTGKRFFIKNQFSREGKVTAGRIEVATPFDLLKSLNVAFNHKGKWNSFQNSGSIEYNGKKVEGSSEFIITKSKTRGKVELLTPTPYSLRIIHKGELDDFSSSILGDFNGDKLNTNIDFKKTRNGAQGSLMMRTPFKGFKKMDINFKHANTRKNMKTSFSVSHPFRSYNDFGFDLLYEGEMDDFRTSGQINTPFRSHPNIKFEAAHKGGLYNFECSGSIECNEQKVTGNVAFKKEGRNIECSAALDTPYPSSHSLTFKLKGGHWTNFESAGAVVYNGKRINGDMAFKKEGNNVEGSGSLETPYFEPQTVSFSGSHRGNPQNNIMEASGTYNGQTINARFAFKRQGWSVEASGSLTTPWFQAQNVEIKIDPHGNLADFTTEASGTYNGQTVSMQLMFKKRGIAVEASGSLATPWFPTQNIDFKIDPQGDLQDLNLVIGGAYNGKRMDGQVTFKKRELSMEGTASLRTPWFQAQNIEFKVDPRGSLQDFTTEVSAAYNGKKVNGQATFKKRGMNMEGSAYLNTPFFRPQQVNFNFKHRGNMNDYTCEASATYNGQSANGRLAFKKQGMTVEATGSLETPWFETQNLEFKMDPRGDLQDFKTDVHGTYNGQSVTGRLAFKKRGTTIEGSGNLETPYPSSHSFSFTHEGTLDDFRCTGVFENNGRKIEGNLNAKTGRQSLEVSGTLKTPFRYYRENIFTLNHRGRLNNFQTQLTVGADGKTVNTNLSFRKQGSNIISSGSIELPKDMEYLSSAAYNINFGTTNTGFKSVSSVEYNRNRIENEVEFSMAGNTVELSASINTPFRSFRRASFNVKHEGSLNNFRTTVSTMTPFPKYKNFGIELSHSGNIEAFTTSVKIDTPFRSLPTAIATITHQGTIEDFTTTLGLDISGEKSEVEISYKKGAGYGGTFRVKTPFEYLRDAEIKINHRGRGASYNGLVDITYNGVKQVDADYSLGTGNRRQMRMNMRQPREAALAMNVINEGNSMNGDADININNSPVKFQFNMRNEKGSNHANREIVFKTILPSSREVGFTIGYELSAEKFAHNAEIQWNSDADSKMGYNMELSQTERRRQTIYDGLFNFKSYLAEFGSTFNHVASPGSLQTEVVFRGSEELKFKNDLVMRRPNLVDFTNTFKIQHPRFTRDVVVTVEGIMNPDKLQYDGKIIVAYASHNFEMSGKVADESSGRNMRYISEFHLTHPSSFLDIGFKGAVADSREAMSIDAEANYLMTRDRQMKNMALRAAINKLKEEMSMQMTNPIMNVELNGKKTVSGDTQHFTLSGNVDNKEMEADLEVNPEQPSMDMAIKYKPGQTLRMTGKYLDDSSVAFEAFHEKNGQRIEDSEFSVNMPRKNILKTRIFMRPNILRDLKNALRMDLGLEEKWQQVSSSLSEEWRYKKAYLRRAAEPLVETVTAIYEMLAEKYEDLYNRNFLYIRDMVDRVRHCALVRNMQYYSEAVYDHMSRKMSELGDILEEQYYYLARHGEELVKEAKEYYTMMYYKYAELADMIEQYLRESFESVQRHPKVVAMLAKLEELKTIDYMAYIRNWRENLNTEAIDRFIAIIKEYYEDIMSHPYMRASKDWFVSAFQKSKYWYQYLEIESKAKAAMKDISEIGWENMRDQFVQWLDNVVQIHKSRWTVWEPSKGLYEFELHLPFNMRDLRNWPHANLQSYITQARNIVKNYIPELPRNDYEFWDMFYKYKPSRNPSDWIPPFSAHATVSGSQHYMTFDKHFYEFSGECSYLLARDFINGLFSVYVNYETEGETVKKSMSVLSNNKHIEINPNFKIMVDGKRVDLPVQFGKTSVRRIGNLIRVDNENGITMACDLIHDRCTLNVTGWYYGKTSGLFGTYDNEPVNDMKNIDGTSTDNVAEMANSWTVGRKCRVANRAVEASFNPQSNRICAKYFQSDDSPFRICFKQVDHEKFMGMCLNDMAANRNDIVSEEGVCNIAAFYVDECNRAGVPIRMPKTCVSCETPDGGRQMEGEELRLTGENVPKAADIVFVVSHQKCNTDVVDRLTDILTLMERAFKQSGLKNNRYALVGYGGEGALDTAHSHTIESDLFNTKQTFVHSLSNFPLMDGDHDDPMAAVKFAANLPFRAGASKTVILVPCGGCEETTVKYSELQRLLLNRDIHLHLLTQHNFRLRASSPKTAYIFGVDREGLFTQKNIKDREMIGDKALRQQAILPKDLCAALAEETDGSIFNSLKMTTSKPAVQKKFIDIFTRVVAGKATPTPCQVCQCVADNTGVGMSVCRNCVVPTPIQLPWGLEGFEELTEMFQEPEQIDVQDQKRPAPKTKRHMKARRLRQRRLRAGKTRKN